MEALTLRDIAVRRGDRTILSGLSLDVAAGQALYVRGPSGSGKTTILNVAGGLMRPDQGQVWVAGESMHPQRRGERDRLRAARVGFVFQHLNLLPELTCAQNIELPLQLRRMPRHDRQQRVASLLRRFGLQGLAMQRPGTLSGGEQQRVAIARALAPAPTLLLVDEPTSSLDDGNAATVAAAIQDAARAGAGILVATHDNRLQGPSVSLAPRRA